MTPLSNAVCPLTMIPLSNVSPDYDLITQCVPGLWPHFPGCPLTNTPLFNVSPDYDLITQCVPWLWPHFPGCPLIITPFFNAVCPLTMTPLSNAMCLLTMTPLSRVFPDYDPIVQCSVSPDYDPIFQCVPWIWPHYSACPLTMTPLSNVSPDYDLITQFVPWLWTHCPVCALSMTQWYDDGINQCMYELLWSTLLFTLVSMTILVSIIGKKNPTRLPPTVVSSLVFLFFGIQFYLIKLASLLNTNWAPGDNASNNIFNFIQCQGSTIKLFGHFLVVFVLIGRIISNALLDGPLYAYFIIQVVLLSLFLTFFKPHLTFNTDLCIGIVYLKVIDIIGGSWNQEVHYTRVKKWF